MSTPPSDAGIPVVAVLCQADQDRPDLSSLEDRVEIRWATTAELPEAVDGADVLFLWDFFSTAVRDIWQRAGSLDWIHVAAAGVDKLLFDELNQSAVIVTNARGIFDRPIAEFVLASILADLKQLHLSREMQSRKHWEHRETETLATQKVLVVGTGAIGREIGRVLALLGVTVRGAGRTARDSDPDFERIVASGELTEHIGWADHVVIAAPLTAATIGLFDRSVFAAMKPGAHLINIGRGPIVDEDALWEAIRSGQLRAASLDVFATEPLPDSSPLWAEPAVIISPHLSGDVRGWRDALAAQFRDNMERYLAGQPLVNVVDKQLGFVPPEGADLGEHLGNGAKL